MRRSDQRRDAVFALYQRDVTGRALEDLLAGAKPFTRELAEGTDAEVQDLDATIAQLSRGWDLDRIATLERSIMRVALHEMHEGLPADARGRSLSAERRLAHGGRDSNAFRRRGALAAQ